MNSGGVAGASAGVFDEKGEGERGGGGSAKGRKESRDSEGMALETCVVLFGTAAECRGTVLKEK